MPTLKLGNVTAMTESGGTVTLDSATVVQGSSMVKLASASVSTAVSYVEVNGLFDDSIYNDYFFSLNDFEVNPWAAGGHPRFEFLTAAGIPHSSGYYWLHGTHYANATGATSQVQTRAGLNSSSFIEMDGTWQWNIGYPGYFQIYIVNPTVAKKTMMRYNWGCNNDGSYMVQGQGCCMLNTTTAITGFRIFFQGTTCGKHQYVFYGIKK